MRSATDRLTRRALAPLLVLALSACATREPAPRPDAGVPAAWRGAAPRGTDDAAAAAIAWPSYFTDPRLQALIALALDNNRDLRMAAARVEQARAQYDIARADKVPTVNGQADQSRTSAPSELQTAASSQRFDLQGVLTYEIDFWGRVAAMSASGRASFLATEEARRQLRLSLVAEVASAYYALLEKDELLELARASRETREQTLLIAIKGRDLGGADDDERLQSQTALESALAAEAQLVHQRNVAGHQLDFLIGKFPGELPPGRPLAEQQPGAALAPGVPSEVLLRRPDVLAAEQRLAAADADIDAARAAFLPRVMLTAALGMASPALATLFSGGAWSYQSIASLPLFDGGRTAATVDGARSRRTLAVADYEKTVQQAFREVADQLSARRSLKLQLDSALAVQQSQALRLKAARGRYEIGVASYREVLETTRALLAARQNTIAVQRAGQDAAAALYKALGGGADVDRPTVLAEGEPSAFSLLKPSFLRP